MEKKNFFNQNAISIMAAVVSMCALILSFYQTSIMREQQYASVRPLLIVGNSMDSNVDSTGRSELFIWNRGIGPALIKYVDIQYKGKHYSEYEFQNVMRLMLNIKDTTVLIPTMVSTATAAPIAASEEIKMIDIQDKKICYLFNQAYFKAGNSGELDITIYFSDVYDRLFKTSLRSHKILPTTKAEIEAVVAPRVRAFMDL